jgi:hypothetical protein
MTKNHQPVAVGPFRIWGISFRNGKTINERKKYIVDDIEAERKRLQELHPTARVCFNYDSSELYK